MPQIDPSGRDLAQPATPPDRFECDLRAEGRGAAWVSPRGELDIASAPRFEQIIHDALGQSLLVIVDLRAVTFMDSTGLHTIVSADARASRSGRRLVIVRPGGQIARLFELVGLSDRLRIVDLGAEPSR